jgi:hypothetical protein
MPGQNLLLALRSLVAIYQRVTNNASLGGTELCCHSLCGRLLFAETICLFLIKKFIYVKFNIFSLSFSSS